MNVFWLFPIFVSFFMMSCRLNRSIEISETPVNPGPEAPGDSPGQPTPSTPPSASDKFTQLSHLGGDPGKPLLLSNGKIYIVAATPQTGLELWAVDELSGVSTLLKDINSGILSSKPKGLVESNGLVYFMADSGDGTGHQLWRTDGTVSGTIQLSHQPFYFFAFATIINPISTGVIFWSDDGTNGFEPWISDGSVIGTHLLKDINPGAGSSSDQVQDIKFYSGYYYFSANNGVNGTELWRTDGTDGGTSLVKDIEPGPSSSSPAFFHVVSSKLFFKANTAGEGVEPWVSDGTGPGTTLLKDIRSGTTSSGISSGAVHNNIFYFVAREGVYYQIWKTDGSTVGTVNIDSNIKLITSSLVFNFSGDHLIFGATNLAGTVASTYAYNTQTSTNNVISSATMSYTQKGLTIGSSFITFLSTASEGKEPWVINNITLSANLLKDIKLGSATSIDNISNNMTKVGGKVLFHASDGTNGLELWSTDGTVPGTALLTDLSVGSKSSRLSEFITNNTLDLSYFTYFKSGEAPYLWKTDGTSANTLLLSNQTEFWSDSFTNDNHRSILGEFNNKLVLEMFDSEFYKDYWTFDLTTNLFSLLYDFNHGNGVSTSHLYADPIFLDTSFLIQVNDLSSGVGLWSSDGTTSGTGVTQYIDPTYNNTDSYKFLGRLGTKGILAAFNPTYGTELWYSDGTNSGTQLLKDINPGVGNSLFMVTRDKVAGGLLYFGANDILNGYELWRTDGTGAGTFMLKDIFPGGGGAFSSVFHGEGLNGNFLFSANDGTNGTELWITDGTPSGTVFLKDIYAGTGSSSPKDYFLLNGQVFFNAIDTTYGREMWVTNGTSVGTQIFKDFVTGNGDSQFSNIMRAHLQGKDVVIFYAQSDGVGFEPWISDGTLSGTFLLRDINSGSGDSDSDTSLIGAQVGDYFYFVADDGVNGAEVWRTDGITAELYYETITGSKSLPIHQMKSFQNQLFILKTTYVNVRELFLLE